MDDRFDFIFISEDLMSGEDGVLYLENSYLAEGQDGNHFNQSVNDGLNTSVSQEIADALYYMSDHLPVSMSLVLGGTVGINENHIENVGIKYDQSTKTLSLENVSENGTFTIYNIEGAILKRASINGKSSFTLELNDLQFGTYIAHVVLDSVQINYKFVNH